MVESCPNLEDLTLSSKTGGPLPNLEGLRKLTTLTLLRFAIYNSSFAELGKLSSLTDLTLKAFASRIESPSLLGKALSQTNVQILHLAWDLSHFHVAKSILDEVQLVRLQFYCPNFGFDKTFLDFIGGLKSDSHGNLNPTSLWIETCDGYFIDGTYVNAHDNEFSIN